MKALEATLDAGGDQILVRAEGLNIVIKRQDEGVSVYTQNASDECLKEDWTLFSEAESDEDHGLALDGHMLAKVLEARTSDVPSDVIEQVMATHNLSSEDWEAITPGHQNQMIANHLQQAGL